MAAVKVYENCSNQYIALPGGVSGLNIAAVNLVMDWLKISKDDRLDIWEKVQIITDSVIRECTEEAERKANKGT